MYRRRKKKSRKVLPIFGYVLFGLILVWLLLSLIKGVPPLKLFAKADGEIETLEKNYSKKQLKQFILDRDSTILSLQSKLDDCMGENDHRKAIINVESETLNLRNKPSLTSDIVLQIPDSSEVQILYFDTEKYILNDSIGKWCKIIYAGEEGWVWGNFLHIIDQ